MDHKEKPAVTDLSHNSIISFRSNESSSLNSSTQNSIQLSESSTTEPDESPVGPKRKRKDSKTDKDSFPSNKRAKQ